MKPTLYKAFFWISIFSIAMGYLESSVVVYLRQLYYPDGFQFPLNPMGRDIITVEIWREAATILMLLGMAMLAGKNAVQRFAIFLFSFAVWDIFYYVFLYVLLGWPPSLMTWDVLFLIPIPWLGPVWSVLLIAILMVFHSCLMIFYDHYGTEARVNLKEWVILMTGSLLVILSWTRDYFIFLAISNPDAPSWSLYSPEALIDGTRQYVPESFNWYLYAFGFFILLYAIVSYYLRNKNEYRTKG